MFTRQVYSFAIKNTGQVADCTYLPFIASNAYVIQPFGSSVSSMATSALAEIGSPQTT